jgi:shikimate dehydrogenase
MVGQSEKRRMNFGLIGKSLGHSFSKDYFENKWRQSGEDHTYVNFEIPTIQGVERLLSRNDLHGLNVTIPYKEAILPYLTELDPTAQVIGAVNCLKPIAHGWKGYNTDWLGFAQSLQKFGAQTARNALILGSGGASKAVAFALQQLGIPYQFFVRNPKGNQLDFKDFSEHLANGSLIVHCTPLGTWPEINSRPPLPYERINATHVLYDLVYNPAETAFLKAGAERGAQTISGAEMLRIQAEEAWKIWTM